MPISVWTAAGAKLFGNDEVRGGTAYGASTLAGARVCATCRVLPCAAWPGRGIRLGHDACRCDGRLRAQLVAPCLLMQALTAHASPASWSLTTPSTRAPTSR